MRCSKNETGRYYVVVLYLRIEDWRVKKQFRIATGRCQKACTRTGPTSTAVFCTALRVVFVQGEDHIVDSDLRLLFYLQA